MNCKTDITQGEPVLDPQVRNVVFRGENSIGDAPESLIVLVKINGTPVEALVDLGAQVTVLSSSFVESMVEPPELMERVSLRGAGIASQMPGHFTKRVKIELGGKTFHWSTYVAQVNDSVILGLDFLKAVGVSIDLPSATISLEGQIVSASYRRGCGGEAYQIAQAVCLNLVVIPPQSTKQVRIRIAGVNKVQEEELVLCPNVFNRSILCPYAVLNSDHEEAVLELTNIGDNFVKVKAGQNLGYVHPANVLEDELDMTSIPANLRQLSVEMEDSSIKISTAEVEDLSKQVPIHLQDLFRRSTGSLSYRQARETTKILTEYQSAFSVDDTDLGCFSAIKHSIDTQDAKPIRQRMRRTPLGFQEEEEKHLKKMLEAGVIKPSSSAWAAVPVLVRKKDGSVRWCLDYRALNKVTVKDAFPLPKIEECLDSLAGTRFYSTLDMNSGYWQIELEESDQHKTAFITKYGLFEWTRMGFGLCNAPATFQRAVQLVLHGMQWSKVLSYLDDVVVFGTTFQEARDNLVEALERFQKYNLRLKPKKCHLFQNEVLFLGRLVTPQGVMVNPGSKDTIRNWPIPKCVRDVESFLGFANYHREFISRYAELSQPLYALTGPKVKFMWSTKTGDAFDRLKKILMETPVLPYPEPKYTFILDCDASDTAIAGELGQIVDGKTQIIAYGSFVLSPEQRKYCTTRKELLAVVRLTRQYRHYLLGRPFMVRTDHNSLTWLMGFKHIQGQLARWLEELAQYDMSIVHRAGKKHINADSLSRIPDPLISCDCYRAGSSPELLPCQGCAFCRRAHAQWARFEEDVDDVVPLTFHTPTQQVQPAEPQVNIQGPTLRSLEVEEEDDREVVSTFFEGYTQDELRRRQLEDQDLCQVIGWMEEKSNPSQATLTLCSPGIKYLWRNHQQLVLKDGVLYYQWETNSQPRHLLVVPDSLKSIVMDYCHNYPTAGHLGQDKTHARLRQRFIWYQLRSDCKEFVQTCATCTRKKKTCKAPRGPLGQYHAGMPMERVHLDILGPLPVSEKGNTCILVIIDQFTKWVECYPIPDQKAEMIAHSFVDDFVARFGCPQHLHTDQGRNVDGNLINSICDLLRVHKTRTTPYHPSSNGQVERYNRTILKMVRCFLEGKSKQWDRHLQLLAAALRTVPHKQTGFSPNMMMLGREVVQPEDIVFGLTGANYHEPVLSSDYVKTLKKTLEEVHRVAREGLKSSQQLQKKLYDRKLAHTKYEVGDLVYKRDTATKKGQSPKLKPVWKGPYLVESVLSPVLIRIGERKQSKIVHHDRLILCRDRAVPLWLRRRRHRLLSTKEGATGKTTEDVLGNLNLDESGEDLGIIELIEEDPHDKSKVEKDRELPSVIPMAVEEVESSKELVEDITAPLSQDAMDGAEDSDHHQEKNVESTVNTETERRSRRGRLIRLPARLQNTIRRLLHVLH